MSTASKNNSNTADTAAAAAAISEAEDMTMFQAARRTGRRNALGDLSEHLAQGKLISFSLQIRLFFFLLLVNTSNSGSDVDKMAPHFQSMSIKH